jgi:uncharacterized protein GlcG (DUF336 family)
MFEGGLMGTVSVQKVLRRAVLFCAILGVSSLSYGGDTGCFGFCTNKTSFLKRGDVGRIISQAVGEARARGRHATIAVVDRVGNVLGVYQTSKAKPTFRIRSGRFNSAPPKALTPDSSPLTPQAGLEEINILPSTFAAVSKAITAAYLSSEGNAFGTRTASQIIQESFNPGETGQPSGPLFGVQFSQLPCGDLVQHDGPGPGIGPRASPLGLAGDPGGLPLYIGGALVGGIGVIADGIYGLDRYIFDEDRGIDELIAVAGTQGYDAPKDRRAERISAGGLLLRLSDVDAKDLISNTAAAPLFAKINNGNIGKLVDAGNFFTAANGIQEGRAFGTPGSGIEPAGRLSQNPFNGLDAFVLTDGASNNRYPPIDGAVNKGRRLTAREVTVVLREGLKVANRARAQIRRPLGSQVRVTLSVTDAQGNILGVARTRDAPIFGIDVSLQKARNASFFSSPDAASVMLASPKLGHYARAAQNFVDPPYRGQLFSDGLAFTDRAIGNLSRPSFPDGILSSPSGPLSRPHDETGNLDGVFKAGVNEWSPFNVGMQLDLVLDGIVTALTANPQLNNCTANTVPGQPASRLANGIQIFPGSVPIYKGDVLVGALGISGDGVDQDDMVAFLGVYNAGIQLHGALGHAPANRRADQVSIDTGRDNVRLRYVQCPAAPFLDSDEQKPCGGK